jgi:hypothetical protein
MLKGSFYAVLLILLAVCNASAQIYGGNPPGGIEPTMFGESFVSVNYANPLSNAILTSQPPWVILTSLEKSASCESLTNGANQNANNYSQPCSIATNVSSFTIPARGSTVTIDCTTPGTWYASPTPMNCPYGTSTSNGQFVVISDSTNTVYGDVINCQSMTGDAFNSCSQQTLYVVDITSGQAGNVMAANASLTTLSQYENPSPITCPGANCEYYCPGMAFVDRSTNVGQLQADVATPTSVCNDLYYYIANGNVNGTSTYCTGGHGMIPSWVTNLFLDNERNTQPQTIIPEAANPPQQFATFQQTLTPLGLTAGATAGLHLPQVVTSGIASNITLPGVGSAFTVTLNSGTQNGAIPCGYVLLEDKTTGTVVYGIYVTGCALAGTNTTSMKIAEEYCSGACSTMTAATTIIEPAGVPANAYCSSASGYTVAKTCVADTSMAADTWRAIASGNNTPGTCTLGGYPATYYSEQTQTGELTSAFLTNMGADLNNLQACNPAFSSILFGVGNVANTPLSNGPAQYCLTNPNDSSYTSLYTAPWTVRHVIDQGQTFFASNGVSSRVWLNFGRQTPTCAGSGTNYQNDEAAVIGTYTVEPTPAP